MDLFEYSQYPERPGYKRTSTSMDAAKAIAPKAQTLRDRAYNAIRASQGGLTADEVATELKVSILAIRPRISELKAMNLIEANGQTRPNEDSGKMADVMVCL